MSDIEDMLSVPEPKVDTERALARLRARVECERIAPVTRVAAAPRRAAVSGWLKGLSAAATVALVATLLTVSGLAETILTIFEPKQIVAVPITSSDLSGASSFDAYGTLTWTEQPKPYDVPDIRDRGARKRHDRADPEQPARGRRRTALRRDAEDDRDVHVQRGEGAAGRRGAEAHAAADAREHGRQQALHHRRSRGRRVLRRRPRPARRVRPARARSHGMPKLIVAQGKPPVVQSDGVTVDQLQSYLLQQPGISPQLAAQIRAIKDPSSTLPVPIPVDMATSKKVTVQGVEGIFVGDSTGLGSAVIWQKDGIVYGVAGTLTEQQVLAVANSLR